MAAALQPAAFPAILKYGGNVTYSSIKLTNEVPATSSMGLVAGNYSFDTGTNIFTVSKPGVTQSATHSYSWVQLYLGSNIGGQGAALETGFYVFSVVVGDTVNFTWNFQL